MEEKYKESYKGAFKPVDLPKEVPTFHHIDCPSCQHKVESSEINIQDKIAKCTSCHAVFSFSTQLIQQETKHEEVLKPVGVERHFFKNEMELAIPQPLGVLYTILLCLLPLMIFIFAVMYFDKGYSLGAVLGSISLFSFSYMLVQSIRTKQNKIYFNVDEKEIRIEWAPKKLVPIQFIPVNEVNQIYTVASPSGIALMAILDTPEGQTHKKLVDGMKSVMVAKYAEQELERHLGIPNKKVSNEITS